MRKYVIGGSIVAVLAVAAVLSTYQGGQPQNEPSTPSNGTQQLANSQDVLPEAGYLAPALALPTLGGDQTVALADLRGKPVVLNFWASWCGPCKMEMPDLETTYQKYKDKVQFYTINLTGQDDAAKAQAFLQEYGVTIPTLADVDNKAAVDYRIASIPSTYAIDPQGVIVEKRLGALSLPQMDGMVQRLVAKAAQ